MAGRPPFLERLTDAHAYGLAFLLVVTQFVVLAAGGEGLWVRATSTALTALILVVVYVTSGIGRLLKRVAVIMAAGGMLVVLSSLVAGADVTRGLSAAVNALLVLTAAFAILRGIGLQPTVDRRTVLGATSVYVMIGLFFASLYGAVGAFDDAPFFAGGRTETNAHFVYFSYITQTTVGYGDFTAGTDLGRTLAAAEALSGQLYLVTIVALVVGNVGRQRRVASRSTHG